MSTQDRVTLSAQERQKLAGIEARLSAADPALARTLRHQQLAGRGPTGSHSRGGWHRRAVELSPPWVGPVALVLGLALMLGTVVSEPWLSVIGALTAATGLGLSGCALQRRRGPRSPRPPDPRHPAS